MAEVNWTAEAQRWLRDIYDYIAADNADAALRVVLGIYEKARLLRQFPELGYVYTANQRYPIRICYTAITGLAMSSRRTATSTYLESSTGRSILIATWEPVIP